MNTQSIRDVSPCTLKAAVEDLKRKEQEREALALADKQRIIEHPAYVDKYMMIYPTYPDVEIVIFNGAKTKIGAFPATPNLRKIFNGKKQIMVKAKIIEGKFELMKVL